MRHGASSLMFPSLITLLCKRAGVYKRAEDNMVDSDADFHPLQVVVHGYVEAFGGGWFFECWRELLHQRGDVGLFGGAEGDGKMGSQCCKSKDDPDLQQFDWSIQSRTSKALESMATDIDYKSLSLNSLRKVTLCYLDMNQEAAKFIRSSQKDIWKDTELMDLVDDYLESSIHIMKFCASLEDCLDRARNSQSIILLCFRDAGDPFTAKVFSSFDILLLQQDALLSKLKSKKSEVDKKLSKVSKLKNMIYYTVIVSAMICIIIAAVFQVPLVGELLGLSIGQGDSLKKWIDSMWEKYENVYVLERERGLLSLMHVDRLIVIQELKQIRVLAEKLQITIKGLLHSADFAIKERDEVTNVMEEIKKNVNGFMETVEVLSQHAKKCNQDVTTARTEILVKIKLSKFSDSKRGRGMFFN
ncbi:UPF0496 protein 1-like [Lycium ferocissimum]|uniref:UPF0496 protein 1-like n=1 Tax=Lycium ferocissimum TaxID=112874 RepID=UPI002816723E|nr:UPF0496 protein 1-like [Lycium ferocissimum]